MRVWQLTVNKLLIEDELQAGEIVAVTRACSGYNGTEARVAWLVHRLR